MQAICTASLAGDLDEVRHLVTDGADPSCVLGRLPMPLWGYELNVIPIVCATKGGHAHVVKYLVQECGVGKKEKAEAMMFAIQTDQTRCAAFLNRHGAVFPPGPFVTAAASNLARTLATHPLAAIIMPATAPEVSRVLQEYKWTLVELSGAFHAMVMRGRWAHATLLWKAGDLRIFRVAETRTTLDVALDTADCPPDLRKMLWSYKILAEKTTTLRLAWISYKEFSYCLSVFNDKVSLLHAPVTRQLRLQVAMTITPNPLWQSFLVKGQLPVTAKCRLMSFVLHEHAHGLPDSLVRHVVGFLGMGHSVPAFATLTGKILARRGALLLPFINIKRQNIGLMD